MSKESLNQTPLDSLHDELGARMVAFAGWRMPVQYPDGIISEHLHTRREAGLFDVSHMGQARLAGADVAAAMEALVPGDIEGLAPGRMRYTVLTDDSGGILDDLMVTRQENGLFLVVNAARKDHDFAHIAASLPAGVTLQPLNDRALLALQGPLAVDVLARLQPGVAELGFLSAGHFTLDGIDCLVSRSGYTGEDGFEISAPAVAAESLARRLLAESEVAPIGLGARDTLRLEAGLCLYGHDIDQTTSPVEAGLSWTIPRRRREEGGFPGADRICSELEKGPKCRRVGFRLEGRVPAREGAEIRDSRDAPVGRLTSGGFSPSLRVPIGMGYLPTALAEAGTAVSITSRGRSLPASVVALPFVPRRYFRSS